MRDDDLLRYGKGLAAMFRGEDSHDARAAAVNFAEFTRLVFQALTKK